MSNDKIINYNNTKKYCRMNALDEWEVDEEGEKFAINEVCVLIRKNTSVYISNSSKSYENIFLHERAFLLGIFFIQKHSFVALITFSFQAHSPWFQRVKVCFVKLASRGCAINCQVAFVSL